MINPNKKFKELNSNIANLEKYIATVEKNAANTYSMLEYRIWQYNETNNYLLYESLLSRKTKKSKFHPLVSIIIPVYNGSDYLSYAIEAALSQTYDNIEIIVVNDGSTDEGKSADVAKKYGKKIRYFEKPNGGVSSALNYGIKKMNGEYFAWLSHDDLITKDHIEKLVEWVSYKDTDYDIPFSCFDLIDGKGNLLLNETIKAQLFCSDFKVSYYHNDLNLLQGEINGGSVLIPKKAFEEFGLFNESQRITQERDMWDRLMQKYHFINIPYCTASIRCHEKQVTNTNNNVVEDTNKKNLDIINNVLKCGNISFKDNVSLLKNLERFYSDNGKTWLSEEVSKLIKSS